MKIRSYLFIYALCILSLSCSSYTKKKFGLERKFDFETKKDFKEHMNKTGLFSLENILYIDSSSLYGFYVDKLKNGHSALYIGTFLNDSVYVRNSNLLEGNTTCKGRLEEEISRNLSLLEYPDSLLTKGKKMSAYSLYHLNDNTTFDINKCLKKSKVFLLYSYSFGTYYNSMYKKIMRTHKLHSKDSELFIVIADPIQMLK